MPSQNASASLAPQATAPASPKPAPRALLVTQAPRPVGDVAPPSPREARNRGTDLLVSGDLEGALAAFREAVEAAPDDASCRQKVAEVLQRLGRTRDAVAEYELAARAWDQHGWLLRAVALCKVILQLDPGHARAKVFLAELRARRGLPPPEAERAPSAARPAPQVQAGPAPGSRLEVVSHLLRVIPLFARLKQPLLQTVREAFTPCTADAGEPILSRGQPAQALYLLLRGRCAVVHPHLDGHETPYPDLVEGDVFGEVALLRSKLATATVRAVTPCLLLKLERSAFEQLLAAEPELRRELQRMGAERLCRTALLLTRPR
jgi:cAMP-dependent protein kinase regulator